MPTKAERESGTWPMESKSTIVPSLPSSIKLSSSRYMEQFPSYAIFWFEKISTLCILMQLRPVSEAKHWCTLVPWGTKQSSQTIHYLASMMQLASTSTSFWSFSWVRSTMWYQYRIPARKIWLSGRLWTLILFP
jgi:hypothetical protein